MSPQCIDVEHIADVATAPEGHALRKHVAECPRCQSLWLEYQAFMKADVKDASHIDHARRALEANIRKQAASSGALEVAPRASHMAWPAWLRPAIVTAMAAVLTVVAVSVWRGDHETPVLRGGSQSVWSLQAPHVSGISVRFEWKAVPDADAYEVEIFDDALNQVLHSVAVTTPYISVERSALANVPAGTTLTWRVKALRVGDVISTSPPEALVLK